MDKHEIFGEVVFKYTREDALNDEILVDISKAAATVEAGIRTPVAVTSRVFDILNPDDELRKQGQDFEGRLWDMWMIFKHELKGNEENADELHFAPLFLLAGNSPFPYRCGRSAAWETMPSR